MAENIEKKEELVLENAETESIAVGMDVDLEDLIRQSERLRICKLFASKADEQLDDWNKPMLIREIIKIILAEDFERMNGTEGQKC